MYLNPSITTLPMAGRASKTQYAQIVTDFAAAGVDIQGLTLEADEKPNTVKRGVALAIKAAKADQFCVVRNGTVFLVTGDKARELGFAPNTPAKPRKKKGEKAPAAMVDGL